MVRHGGFLFPTINFTNTLSNKCVTYLPRNFPVFKTDKLHML